MSNTTQKAPAKKRRSVQFMSLFLLHSSWGPEVKWLCNPVLSCHSCVLAWFACPIGVFVHYGGWQLFPYLALGTLLVLGALVGRLLCGWVCPFGLVQDLLYRIPSPKFHMPAWADYIKYLVLGLTVILFPYLYGEETLLSFCRFCPASALQITIPNLINGSMTEVSVMTVAKLAVLALVLILAVLSTRSFCKVLCPIGAIMAPLNYISVWRMKSPTHHCVKCGRCDTVCPQDGGPMARIADGKPSNRAAECIVCHDCQKVCPRPAENRD